MFDCKCFLKYYSIMPTARIIRRKLSPTNFMLAASQYNTNLTLHLYTFFLMFTEMKTRGSLPSAPGPPRGSEKLWFMVCMGLLRGTKCINKERSILSGADGPGCTWKLLLCNYWTDFAARNVALWTVLPRARWTAKPPQQDSPRALHHR